MLSAGTILQARYRIVRQLGQGGMGAVYEAVDERLDTTVALKETLFSDEKLRKQFEREARLLARLHHQALPRVSDHFNEGDGQFLVMQYIAGEDLGEMQAHRNGPFPQDEVLRWADQLCDALDYLHTQDPQIIHRDIKPQNLKLTSRGQIVLLDFGLAKGSAGQMSVVTTSASIFGYTPNYAPLEQVQGLGTDARSDIYSLAATLYHLMTSVKPPDALSRAGALVNGQPDPLVSAHQLTPAVSEQVAAALGIGMSQKRDDRFPSATAMSAGLRAAGEGQLDATLLTAARAAPFAAASTVSAEAKTRLAGAQTRGVAGEAQTLLAADATKLRSSVSESTALRPPPGRSRAWLAAPLVILVLVGGAAAFYAYRARQQQQTPPIVVPSPQETQAAQPTPASVTSVSTLNQPAEEKNKKRDKAADTSQAKPKTDNAIKVPAAAPPDRTGSGQASEPHQQRDRFPNPNPNPNPPPPVFAQRNPPPGRHPERQPGNDQLPSVRTLPNGTRMVIQPDGTRIMTMPNGSTRVIPPGVRPNRKRP
jgi:serine/threonine protein kinase